ncbi:MAG: PEP-CTERM sorting domain-containing protein [candidate division Zixibacteria bacterium]|nr:PEP-CTERM sorting domain-containing protein [candidate division Zixibacteria bacterium]
MTIYQRRNSHPMKWVLAFVLFCLVLGWTMSDVYGTESGQSSQGVDHNTNDGTQQVGREHSPTSTNPSPTPEPSTIILLAMGLGGGAMMLRRKKS